MWNWYLIVFSKEKNANFVKHYLENIKFLFIQIISNILFNKLRYGPGIIGCLNIGETTGQAKDWHNVNRIFI